MRRTLHAGTLLIACALLASTARAQSGSMPGMDMGPHQHGKPVPAKTQPRTMRMDCGEPKSGSGTSWLPCSSPEHAWMTMRGRWMLMAHGNLFLTFNHQGGPRGAGKLESENWLMLMEEHGLGKAKLQLRQMFSAEPLTAPHPGFPELFQTGETYHGAPLVDHQHPHDVFGELAAKLTVPLNDSVNWFVYGGPAGEPAMGPVAFLHRPSAQENPNAPLGHHLQDSTHISYGVITSGFDIGPNLQLEASAFNGREPDERRYNFDFGPLDSWSARISGALKNGWGASYSYGHLVHPEALEPGDVDRQSASLMYTRAMTRGYWATSLVWGRNHRETTGANRNGYLLESTLNFAECNYAFTRLELVDKDELDLPLPLAGQNFRVAAFTFGGVRDLVHNARGQIGLGTALTFYSKPAALDPIYGRSPVSLQVFLRFRPGERR